ncbi:MAG: hypothetical protein IJT73_05185, partial [Selenomonadaceae bacterium]|nr:hypothetical protein [Selenomonadaceae bacterium]
AILHKHLPWHEDDDLVSVEVVPQGFMGVVRIEQDGEDRELWKRYYKKRRPRMDAAAGCVACAARHAL